jgi:photosystem II stability/assembly factor-like uncharacterized protein
VLHGKNRRFGFNTVSPQSTIDISGDLERTIDIHSSLVSNKNVVARNNADHGFTMNIDQSGAYIDFYVDNSINSLERYNARLLCEPGGKFTIDVTNTMQFRPHIIFSEVATDDMIADERIIIYDNAESDLQYLKDVYDASYLKTGTAMYLVAGDNSSNVFFRTSTREGRGLTLGGGFFPGNRINGTIALIDASNVKNPALNIVSSKTANGSIIPRNLRASIGVNKHDVYQTPGGDNRYAMDINGPVRVGHQEVIVAADVAFEVIEMAFYDNGIANIGIAIGTPIEVYEPSGNTIITKYTQYFLKTTDGGYTWTANRIINKDTNIAFPGLENGTNILRSVRMSSSLNYLIAGTGRFLFYTDNGGTTWKQIEVDTDNNGNTFDIESLYLNIDIFILGLNIKDVEVGYIVHQNGFYNVDISANINPTINTGLTSVNAIWGHSYRIFIVGNNGLRSANIEENDPVFGPVESSQTILYGVHGYHDGATNHVIAVGENIIRYSHNNGATWSSVAISGVLRSVAVVNATCAIAVGNAGLVMYSIDGYASWTIVSAETLNTMGNGAIITGIDFTNISATSIDKFAISGTISTYSLGTPGRTKMYHLYAPYFLNRPNHNVLEASGNMVVSGDIWIREEGSLRTNNRAFYLLPENTNDIYVGTTSQGNTNVRNRFTVAGTTQVVDLSGENADFSGNIRVETIQSRTGLYAGKLAVDFIVNSALDISGNAFATRLGLGTTGANMNYQLDISGSGYVSVNVDVSGNMSVQKDIFNYGTIYQW